ncbi:uncharacterized protein LOC142139945 [Mixophyes fleayi]|uniref:uncharacterized protein LOC142139945 n=1 Tax=Mixophyes fleayi TaxID=3061075 RepID=UPI003F4DA21B
MAAAGMEQAVSGDQILELTKDREDQASELLDLKFQLHESSSRVKELEEASKNYHLESNKNKQKTEEMIQQLEEVNLFLQNAKDALRSSETELQNARGFLIEAIKEKEIKMKEIEESKVLHVLQLSALQSEVDSLKETLISEQKILQESENKLKMANLQAQDNCFEHEEITKANKNQKKQIEQLKCDLDESIKVQKDLENQVTKEKSENQILLKKEQDLVVNQENLQEQFHNIVMENTDLKKLVGDLQDVQIQLQDTLKSKEEVIDDLKIKISCSSVDVDNLSEKIEDLKTEISQGKIKYAEQKMTYEKLFIEKEEMSRQIDLSTKDLKNIQKDLKSSKQHSDQTMKTIEKLEQTNDQLRQANESLKEQLNEKDKECRNHHNEDKKRNTENEFSKKEKQQKALENKFGALKKQVENKNKTIEELHQKIKSLKKKMKGRCKQCSGLQAKVNGLHVQLEDARVQHEATVSSKQKEIADAKTKEEILLGEVEKCKLASDETIKLQRENDIRCQHKISEMVALMEKHKNQYDKIVEEKDAELDQLRAREQEIYSTRTVVETELSNKKNEIVTLRMQLQQEKEEKDKFVKGKMCLKTNMKHKEVQTIFTETPKQTSKVGDIQNSSSYSKKTQLTDLSRCLETVKKSDKKDTSPWTSSRNSKYTIPKTYYVKTPQKYDTLQHEIINIHPKDSTKKKRKVAVEFDFHSDSSDQTDILGICDNEGMFKALYHMSPSVPNLTSKKILADASLMSPSSGQKVSTMKKMREAGWAAISKVERKRKMKAAEKIFR